jgi:hypothetical protein
MDAADVFGTTLADRSGSGFNGTLLNLTSANIVPGQVSNAFNFAAGSSSAVSFGASASVVSGLYGLTQGSVSAWVKPTYLVNAQGSIVGPYSGPTLALYRQFAFAVQQINSSSWGLYDAGVKPGNVVTLVSTSISTYSYGSWYHVAYTTGAFGNAVYVNGQKVAMTYANGSSATQFFLSQAYTAGDVYCIGSLVTNQTGLNFYNGAADDLRIYNRPLTAAEIAEMYAVGRANHQ